eukprot:13054-Heterococcus_DN1.PRE.2
MHAFQHSGIYTQHRSGIPRLLTHVMPWHFLHYAVASTTLTLPGSKLFTLELVGHDEYTRKLLDDRAIFPQSFAQLAAARLAETLSSAKLAVR